MEKNILAGKTALPPFMLPGALPTPRPSTPWALQWSEPDRSLQNLMHFRYYASSMGRFMKPDNMITNAMNPQSWNLYSYVNNSPINANDPTGHAMSGKTSPAYMQGSHSFGMSWFEQFDWWRNPSTGERWTPWAGQTAGNSWYWGSTYQASAVKWFSSMLHTSGLMGAGNGDILSEPQVLDILLTAKYFISLLDIMTRGGNKSTPIRVILGSDLEGNTFVEVSGGLIKQAAADFELSNVRLTEVTTLAELKSATSSVPEGTVGVFIFHHSEDGAFYLSGNTWTGDRCFIKNISASNFMRVVFWGCFTADAAHLMAFEVNQGVSVYGVVGPALALSPLVGDFIAW